MRRFLLIAVLCFGSGTIMLAGPIGVVFNDEFESAELNEKIWNTKGNVFSAGSGADPGKVKLDAHFQILSQIDSIKEVAPESRQTVELAIGGVVATAWGEGVSWGFSNPEGTDRIMVQSPVGQVEGQKKLIVTLRKDGGEEQRFAIGTANQTDGNWQIDWSVDRIVIKRNEIPVFDSKNDTSDDAGGWKVPTAAMNVVVLTYINDNTITLDSISLGVTNL